MHFTVDFDLANSPSLNDLSAGAQAEVLRLVNAAAQSWANHIRDNYLENLVVTIGIRIDASAYDQSVIAQGAPEAWEPWTYQNFSTRVHRGTAETKISTNIDTNGGDYDIVLDLTPFAVLNQMFFRPDPLNPTAIPADKYDAMSVFQREIGHGLGIMAFSDAITDPLFQTDRTNFESHVRLDGSGNTIFIGGNVDDLPEGVNGIVLDPDNIGYFKEDGNFGSDLMSAVLAPGEIVGISEIDLAVLKDILVPVKEPSNLDDVIYDTWGSTRDLHLLNGGDTGYAAPDGSRLFGDGSTDLLFGGAGDDYLDGGAGNDFMQGAAGNDTYVVDDPLDKVDEYASEGTDRVKVGFSYTLGDNVEELEVTGSQAVTATGNTLNNYLLGNGSATLVGLGGDDTYFVVLNDTVVEATAGGHDRVIAAVDFTLPDNVEDLELYPVDSNAGWGDFNGTGNSLGNFLKGNVKNNQLDGAGGDDTLDGGGGDDVLIGGSGNDTLRGGDGDTLIGGTGDDVYIFEGSGNAPNFLVIENAGEGHDTIYADADFWMGMPNVEDLVLQGAGSWIGQGNELDNVIKGNSGGNYLVGNGGDDELYGFGGDDIILGSDGNDVIYGGGGDDSLIGEAGDDIIYGGDGNDVASFSGSYADYDVARYDANFIMVKDMRSGAPEGTDLLRDVEWLVWGQGFGGEVGPAPVVTVTARLDRLSGQSIALTDLLSISDQDGNSLNITKYQFRDATAGANSGHFVVNGVAQAANTVIELTAAQLAQASFVTGTAGDTIQFRFFDGVLWSAPAAGTWSSLNFTIYPPLNGTSGDDSLGGTAHPDAIYGLGGNDTIQGLADDDQLYGGSGDDLLYGGSGDDVLYGEDGDDQLFGGTGNNLLNGGAGNDMVVYEDGRDITVNLITGETSRPDGLGGTFTDTLVDIENAKSTTREAILIGNDSNNILIAGPGSNVLQGRGGDDRLVEYDGWDSGIDGGTGRNSLYISRVYDTSTPGSPYPRITSSFTMTFTPGAPATMPDTTQIWNIEVLQLITGDGDDAVTFNRPGTGIQFTPGTYTSNLWDAGAGNDTVTVDFSTTSAPLTMGASFGGVYWQITSGPSGLVNLSLKNVENYRVIGGQGNDWLVGQGGADVFTGGGGDDTLDGGDGIDTAVYSGNSANYVWTARFDGKYTVSEASGTDTLSGIEKLQFADRTVTLHEPLRPWTGDFTGDGKADILWEPADGDVTLWRMNRTGGTGSAASLSNPQVTANAAIVSIGDYNGDGEDDVLWQSPDGSLNSWQMDVAGIKLVRGMGAIESSGSVKGSGDFGADGRDDILWQKSDGNVFIWQMAAGGYVGTKTGLGMLNPVTWSLSGVADFNGDGKADVLLRNANGDVYNWLMNGAAIADSNLLGRMDSSWSIKGFGDFGGDGKADILWQKSNGMVAIWQIDGAGKLASSTNLGVVNPNVWSLSTGGDYNGDGKADVLLNNIDSSVANWLMDGAAIADSKALGTLDVPLLSPRAVANDLNGDLRADVLWQRDDGTITLWEMGASGNVDTSTIVNGFDLAATPLSAVADFNGDGKVDLLLRKPNGTVTELLMNGGSVSATNDIGTMDKSWSIKGAGDFGGDGKADILWQKTDGTVVIWQMDGTGAVASSINLGVVNPATWSLVNVDDYNGDGKADVLLRNANGDVYNWLMNGASIAGSNRLAAIDKAWSFKGSGDFGGDGYADLVWQGSDGAVVIWEMNAAGRVGSGTNLGVVNPAVWSLSALGDYNGDGKTDILLQNYNGTRANWLMDGAAIVGSNTLPSLHPFWKNPLEPRARTRGDFNGDGTADILWQKNDGTAVIWSVGRGLFMGSGAADPIAAGSQVAAVSDLTGDGRADILIRGPGNSVSLRIMNGGTITQTKALQSMDSSWSVKGAADFDGDGISDVLWHKSDGTQVVWRMNSAGDIQASPTLSWSLPMTDAVLKVADFNADGKADILRRNLTSGMLTLNRQDGSEIGPADPSRRLGNMDDSWSLKGVGDFGGDGSADMLWQKSDGNVAIWQMTSTGMSMKTNLGVVGGGWSLTGVGDYNADGKSDVLLHNSNGTVANWIMDGSTIMGSNILGNLDSASWHAVSA